MQNLLQLTSDHWEALLRVVADWLPNSLVVYHWLKIASTRMAPILEGASCYVDRWPDPECVCCIDPVVYDGLPKSYFLSFALKFDRDESIFSDFLQRIDSASRLTTRDTHAVCGLSLPSILVDTYCTYFRRKQCSVKYYDNDAYWIAPESRNAVGKLSIDLPVGFYFDTLRLDEAQFVDETWPHRWLGSLELNMRKLKYMPNVCVRHWPDRELASFEIMHSEFGLINHLYTKSQFRRLGLAKAVELRQMQKALDADMIPYKLVVCENEAPVMMTKQIKFWQKYGRYPFVEIFTPEGRKLVESSDGSCASGESSE